MNVKLLQEQIKRAKVDGNGAVWTLADAVEQMLEHMTADKQPDPNELVSTYTRDGVTYTLPPAPAPKKTRGEEVAEQEIRPSGPSGTILGADFVPTSKLEELRRWFAAAIDAERRAEREQCAAEAWRWETAVAAAYGIRKLPD